MKSTVQLFLPAQKAKRPKMQMTPMAGPMVTLSVIPMFSTIDHNTSDSSGEGRRILHGIRLNRVCKKYLNTVETLVIIQ